MRKLLILAIAFSCLSTQALADNIEYICVPTISTTSGVSITSCVPVSIAAPFPTSSN